VGNQGPQIGLPFQPSGLQLEVLDQIDQSDWGVAANEGYDHADEDVIHSLLPIQRIRPLGIAQRLGELGILNCKRMWGMTKGNWEREKVIFF
jgi:hypothetical protein